MTTRPIPLPPGAKPDDWQNADPQPYRVIHGTSCRIVVGAEGILRVGHGIVAEGRSWC
jgi:hypothetical protein